jgi:membrane protein YqaA with SNARE-associated domain
MELKFGAILPVLGAIIATVLAFLLAPYLEQVQSLGYFGAFIIALVSNASVLLPAPGWAIIIAMGRVLDPIPLALAAGIGSGLGELSGYLLGYGGSNAVDMKKMKEFGKQKKWLKKYDMAGIFFLAAIPNPLFDLAGIAAGALKMPIWRFLLPCMLGKIVKTLILAELGLLTLLLF